MANCILVSDPGYVVSICNFAADNGLANLAGSLMNAGHNVRIFDYANAEDSFKLLPNNLGVEIGALNRRYVESMIKGAPDASLEREIRRLMDELEIIRKDIAKARGEELSDYVRENKVDFVGFKLWTGEGFDNSIIEAEEIRRSNPNIKIIGGGPHVAWFEEKILEYTNAFDAVSYGEGEEVIRMYVDYTLGKLRLGDIPNTLYRDQDRIRRTEQRLVQDLDAEVHPVYSPSIYLAMDNNKKLKMILVDESRGCPYSCNFCIHPLKSGKIQRSRNPAKVVDFIEYLVDDGITKVFRLAGSNTPHKLKLEIADEIMNRGLDVVYTAFSDLRGKAIKPEDFKKLYASGCYSLFFGIESGSQELLDKAVNKKVKIEDIVRIIRDCNDAGVEAVGSIIYPLPGETEKTRKETEDLILNKIKLASVCFSFPGLVKGTRWGRNPEKFGIESEVSDLFMELMHYKIKLLFPPTLWQPLPYKINGKRFDEYAKDAESLLNKFERAGILTNAPDEMVMIAHLIGMNPRELRDRTRRAIATGDKAEVQDLIGKMNRCMKP